MMILYNEEKLQMNRKNNEKYIDYNLDKKTRSRDSVIRAVFSFIIGGMIFLLALFALIPMKSVEVFLLLLVPTGIFTVFGLVCLKKPERDLKRSMEQEDETSETYRKKQEALNISREKFINKSHKHGGLLRLLYFRDIRINTSLFLTYLIFGPLAILAGGFSIFSIISIFIYLKNIVLWLFALILSLFGYNYRNYLKAYRYHGLDKKEAELDFAGSSLYTLSNGFISVSERFIIANEQLVFIESEKINWVYSAFNNYNEYQGRHYSHTTRQFYIGVGLTDGRHFTFQCPEELCSVLVDEIHASRLSVISGYSPELHELFNENPAGFKDAAIYCRVPDREPYGPVQVIDGRDALRKQNKKKVTVHD